VDQRYGIASERYRVDLPLQPNERLEYRVMVMQSEVHTAATLSSWVDVTKLSCHHIVDGRCPHKGYDLTNVVAVDGVKECPMHALCFDEETEQLIL